MTRRLAQGNCTALVLLWTCVVLFAARVLGQFEALLLTPDWLPDMDAWYSGLMPYYLLLPAQILSACTCLCPQFPGVHSIEWVRASEDERARDFDAVGLAPELRLEARHWATSEFERSLGWPGMFLRAEDVLAARSRFFAPARRTWERFWVESSRTRGGP